jgi:hypothetical protein
MNFGNAGLSQILRCNSLTNINIQRSIKSYNVEHALERYLGKTPYNSCYKHSFYNSKVLLFNDL